MIVTVELVTTIVGSIGISVLIVLWFFRQMGAVRKELSDYKLYVSEHYTTKNGLKDELESMARGIERLEQRMDQIFFDRQGGRKSSAPP